MAAAIQSVPIKLTSDTVTLPVMYRQTFDIGEIADAGVSLTIDNTRSDGYIGLQFPGMSGSAILIDKAALQAAVTP